jgi:hypothetical protein
VADVISYIVVYQQRKREVDNLVTEYRVKLDRN